MEHLQGAVTVMSLWVTMTRICNSRSLHAVTLVIGISIRVPNSWSQRLDLFESRQRPSEDH